MKTNDLKNIYPNSTQDFHNAMLCSLVKLNESSPRRYKKRRVLKIVVICIMIACLCTTSVLAVSNLYGVFTEKEKNYGINVKVVPEESKDLPEFVKLTLNYLPEGVIETQIHMVKNIHYTVSPYLKNAVFQLFYSMMSLILPIAI